MSKKETHPRTLKISEVFTVAVPELATFSNRKEREIFARFVARMKTAVRKAEEEIECWQETGEAAMEFAQGVLDEHGIDVNLEEELWADEEDDDEEECTEAA